MTELPPTRPAACPPGRRFCELFAAWVLVFVATPGCVLPDGSWLVATIGVGAWGAASLRPLGERRRRALLAEWLANSIGIGSLMWWTWWVSPIVSNLYIGLAMGVYVGLGGGLARALARRFSPGVAVALGWLGAEVARTVLVPPLGLGWFQLGHSLHATELLVGSARVWGLEGLTFVLAALAGVVTELSLRRRVTRSTLALGGGALGLALVLSAVTAPPATRPGPRVRVVQPGIPQEVKSEQPRSVTLQEIIDRTLASFDGEGDEVDLICWGETMLGVTLLEENVEPALAAGRPVPSWWGPLDVSDVPALRESEDVFVRRMLLRRLPAGVSFLTGAIVLDDLGDGLARRNAVVLYDDDGRRGPAASKRFLVPGAETMLGLERWAWVRDACHWLMGYTPDFAPADETGILELATRSGERYRIAATVCFDNAFLEAYTEPLADGPVDLHVVVSNEAWYRDAFELDQMLAFSRIAAIASGRTLVRAANSGISAAFGPDGTELARLVVDGSDRSVAGILTVEVPVPVSPEARPPYVGLRSGLRWGILALVLALWLRSRRPSGSGTSRHGNHRAAGG